MFGISEGINLVTTTIDKVWPDANEVERGKLSLLAKELQGAIDIALEQAKTNTVSASSSSVFVAGARPFILWVCGIALAYAVLIEPIMRFILVTGYGYVGEFPIIDTTLTSQALLGLLGLGGMRSFEKSKGIQRERM